jgi:hypothetical protein
LAVGDYEKIEAERRAAWRAMQRAAWGSEEHAELTRHHDALAARRDEYLRDLLARLPFRWHVAHAYTGRETGSYSGGDHVVVDAPIRIGRLVRQPGDALSRPKSKFWGLYGVEEGRLPTAVADIRIAERIAAGPSTTTKTKKSTKQLDREIAEALGAKPRS